MAQLLALYNQPEDPAAFDKHYNEVHIPIAKKLPGLQRYTVSHPGPDADGKAPLYYLVAVLEFADGAALGTALNSPEMGAAAEDLGNFAGAGITLLTGDSEEV